MGSKRVFILESPNALDLLQGIGERQALEQVCRMLRYDVAGFLIRNLYELKQTLTYISSIKGDEKDTTPLFIHLSVHGNSQGIGVGADTVAWGELAKLLARMYKRLAYYHGPVIIIVSSCGANTNQLSDSLTEVVRGARQQFLPPDYIFVFSTEKVQWNDALVAWTIFYRRVGEFDFTQKQPVQALLNQLHRSDFGRLQYYRWENAEKKYLRYVPKAKV